MILKPDLAVFKATLDLLQGPNVRPEIKLGKHLNLCIIFWVPDRSSTFFGTARNQTQGLTYARKVLHH